jgi:L-fuconolactonase
VCTLTSSYDEVFSRTQDATAALSPAERQALFGGTAASFYRLSDPT